MCEYYLWLNIFVRVYEPDGNESTFGDLEKIRKKIQKRIDNVSKFNQIVNLKYLNGNLILILTGASNHKSGSFDEIFNLFVFISEVAEGTYGLLYLKDDEDDEHDNDFQVWRMARGKIEKMEDPFLSPCIPTIESELELLL